MYSVSEVAKKLAVSTTAVYKKIGRPEFKDLVTTEEGRTLISDELYSLLESSFKPKSNEPKNNLEESLVKVIESLNHQLAIKDSQIMALQNHIDELTEMNVNQQKLHGSTMRSQEEVKLIEEPKKRSFFSWNR